MARIEFHFNAPALVPYACRLLRKIHARDLRAQVLGSPQTLALLDQALWTFSTLDFLPHCLDSAPQAMRQAGRILLSERVKSDWPAQVLVNLGEAVPEGFEPFERVVDVVSIDELNRAQGRERWREYARMGHELLRHDVGALDLA